MGVIGVLCRGVARNGGMKPAEIFSSASARARARIVSRIRTSGVAQFVKAIVVAAGKRHADRAASTGFANLDRSSSMPTFAPSRGGAEDVSHLGRANDCRNPRTSASPRASRSVRPRSAAFARDLKRSPRGFACRGARQRFLL
jgi:hypothetical protein